MLEGNKKKRCSVCSGTSATIYCPLCKEFFCSLTTKLKKKGDDGKYAPYTSEEVVRLGYAMVYNLEVERKNTVVVEQGRKSCYHVRHEKAWLRSISDINDTFCGLVQEHRYYSGGTAAYNATPHRLSMSINRHQRTMSSHRQLSHLRDDSSTESSTQSGDNPLENSGSGGNDDTTT